MHNNLPIFAFKDDNGSLIPFQAFSERELLYIAGIAKINNITEEYHKVMIYIFISLNKYNGLINHRIVNGALTIDDSAFLSFIDNIPNPHITFANPAIFHKYLTKELPNG